MTQSASEQSPDQWLPTGQRVRDAVRAAAVPVIACAVALAGLAGLAAWTSSGAAGTPPQIAAGNGRVFLPYGNSRDTAAFFDITNIGGAEDQLTGVTSPGVEKAMLSRHRSSGLGADTMVMTGSVSIPAGGTVTMSPSDVSVMARAKTGWQAGDTLPFVLHFRHSAPVLVVAVVIRPGS
ncbi:copper chaperone PCu(A)C [Streptomyces sp. NPDC097617]|uniref:copper chaperone PCu(A)C n=1 Tax=Streptomyces sp. NPDC097617 TaxID=3366091 RepID=UPI00381B17B8